MAQSGAMIMMQQAGQ